MPSVYAAICVHRGVSVKVLKTMRFFEHCPEPKITFHLFEGDALIDRSRARAATDFLLNSKDDVLFFMDDDILFYDETQIRNLVKSVYQQGIDIIGGAYSIKDEIEPTLAIRTLENKGDFPFGKEGGIFEVRYVSSGCMAISRKVLEAMKDCGKFHYCHPKTLKFYPFFEPQQKELDGEWVYLSEDWSFCENARNLGFKVYVDSTIKLGHIGPKAYDWDDFFRPKKQVMESIVYSVDIQKQ